MVSRRKSLRRYAVFLALVGLERVLELALSRRHERWAKARGGVELAPGQLWAMAALHSALLPASFVEAALRKRPPPRLLTRAALATFAGADVLRWWAIATLGPRWSVRVIVVPGLPLVTSGPYRFVRHPNYLAVIAQVAAIPLAHGAVLTAAVASAVNGLLLARRIATEERALGLATDYVASLGRRPRLVPGLASREHR